MICRKSLNLLTTTFKINHMIENEISKLRKEVENCKKCPLYKTRNKVVFGNGSLNAKIFLVGEGPGFDEDRTGIAFVGRSGKLLDKILEACGFTREKHVFIGNIVKCRPPQNRIPTIDEQSACLPFLEKQIELLNPEIIVTLGSTAYKGLFDSNAKITRERGNWKIRNNRLVMPTYHPSALLRNPALKKDTWEDFKKVIIKYRELVDPEHFCKYI